MDQQKAEGQKPSVEADDGSNKENAKERWFHLDWSFWAEHPAGILFVAVGLLFMSPLVENNVSPKQVWIVAMGAWMLSGAVIWFIAHSVVASMNAAAAPTTAVQNEPTNPDIPEIRRSIPETEGVLVPGNVETPKYVPPDPERFRAKGMPQDTWERVKKRLESGEVTPPDDALFLFVGRTRIWSDNFPITLVAQGDEKMVVIDKEADGIALTAKFFDENGKIVGTVIKNKFYVNKNNYFRMDRRPSQLTVFNDEDRMVFHIEFLNSRTIYIVGDFFVRDAQRIFLSGGALKKSGEPKPAFEMGEAGFVNLSRSHGTPIVRLKQAKTTRGTEE